MDSEPNIPRREKLVGKYDSKSVALKFEKLPEAIKEDLDKALNKVSLAFETCFTEGYLDNLNIEKRKELSSLNGDLNLNINTGTSNKETIEAIVKILNY